MATARRDPWSLKRGDAVVLTSESSKSFLYDKQSLSPGERLVGMVLERLGDAEDEAVWGVLVNGELHQVLDSEIESIMPGGA